MFTEALTHGTLPWRARYERRSLIYKYSPGNSAYSQVEWPPGSSPRAPIASASCSSRRASAATSRSCRSAGVSHRADRRIARLGRMSLACAACSTAWVVQPIVRLTANVGVKSARGSPDDAATTPANSTVARQWAVRLQALQRGDGASLDVDGLIDEVAAEADRNVAQECRADPRAVDGVAEPHDAAAATSASTHGRCALDHRCASRASRAPRGHRRGNGRPAHRGRRLATCEIGTG